jgi:hypothetical protein
MYNFGIWAVWMSVMAFFSLFLGAVAFLSALYTYLKINKTDVIEKYEDVIKMKEDLRKDLGARNDRKRNLNDGI